jgi:hypothetical protein
MMKTLTAPRLLIVLLAGMAFAFVPSSAHAQSPPDDDGDVLIRINGDVVVESGEIVDTLVVIDADAVVEGTARDVLVIHGNLLINGTVENDVTVIDGDLELGNSASVDDVQVFSGNIDRASGATVTGDIEEHDEFWAVSGTAVTLFSIWFWVASTLVLVAGALVFAAVGGRQLTNAAMAMTRQFTNTVVGGVFLWIALPIIAFAILFTVVGILLSLTVFVFVLPIMWVLGYIVAGARLGLAITGRMGREQSGKPLLAAGLGVFILQLIAIIPFLGWLVVAIAGFWGAGALAYTAFAAAGGKSFHGPSGSTSAPAAAAQQP